MATRKPTILTAVSGGDLPMGPGTSLRGGGISASTLPWDPASKPLCTAPTCAITASSATPWPDRGAGGQCPS